MYRLILVFVFSLLAGYMPVYAQIETELGWTVVSVEDFSQIVGSQYTLNKAVIAPNGESVAWVEPKQGLCIYTFNNKITLCHQWTWSEADSSYMSAFTRYDMMYFSWSPNSQHIAFAQDPFREPYDSDIWLFDTATTDFSNLTDDGIDGMVRISSEETSAASVDFMPMWSSDSNSIYYFSTRYAATVEKVIQAQVFLEGLSLSQLNVGERSRTLISDFSNQLQFSIPAAALSGDDKQLAFFAYDKDSSLNKSNNGIWIYDLTKDNLRKVVDTQDFFVGLPDWAENWYVAGNTALQWMNNNQNLIVAGKVFTQDDTNGIVSYHSVDLSTNATSSIVDVSAIPLLSELVAGQSQVNVPYVGFTSASDNLFFEVFGSVLDLKTYLTQTTSALGMMNGNHDSQELAFYGVSYYGYLFQMSENNRVLLDGRTLLTLDPS